jgi:hypothetical protein
MGQMSTRNRQELAVGAEDAVLRVLRHDGPMASANAISARTPHRRQDVLLAIYDLLEDGRIVMHGGYYHADPPKPATSGLQISYRKAVRLCTEALSGTGVTWSEAEGLAELYMSAGLSDRQRALLDERSNGS